MDAGGRVTQEQLPRSGSFEIPRNNQLLFVISPCHEMNMTHT